MFLNLLRCVLRSKRGVYSFKTWWMFFRSLRWSKFCCWMEYSIDIIRSRWLIMLLRSSIALIFFPLALSKGFSTHNSDTGMVKSVPLTMNLSSSLFIFINLVLRILTLLVMLTCLRLLSSWRIVPFILMWYPFLFLIMLLILELALSEINLVTPAFFWLLLHVIYFSIPLLLAWVFKFKVGFL